MSSKNVISIHAPREGSDVRRNGWTKFQKISIHAPREGSDSHISTAEASIV